MLKNYFKTTLRSLKKNKLFSVINIFGLAAGLAAATFIFQYTFFELSHDQYHEAHNDIYRVINHRYEGEKLIQSGQITYSAVGKQMADDYPEVLRHTTINTYTQGQLWKDERVIELQQGYYVHPSFYEMFDVPVLAGNKEQMLSEIYSIVLTETAAKTFFQLKNDDYTSILGELVNMDQHSQPFKVTGVIEDAPLNSHLPYEFLVSRNTLFQFWRSAEFDWTGSDFYHYLQLVPGADAARLEAKFEDFSQTYFKGDEVTGTFEEFRLQALDDIYLYSDYEYEIIKTGNGKMVWALMVVAFFILLMAWINYINLTNSRALERAREVGVRKVVGAGRSQLIRQFMTEALVVNALAVVFAFTLIQIFQSQFNDLVGEQLSLMGTLTSQFNGVSVSVVLGAILILGTLLSGFYPSLVLSNYKPTEILKGKFQHSGKGNVLRKGLVVFQFAISTILIAGTLLVYQQVNYMRDQDLGVDMEQVMVVEGPSLTSFDSTFIARIASFKNELKTNPNVFEAGTSSHLFGDRLPRVFNATPEGSTQGYMLNRINADYGFLDTYGIGMAAGRNFMISDHNTDGALVKNIMINKKAAEMMGFVNLEDVVNKRITFWGREWFIIGVTEDFHNRALNKSIEPIVFIPFYDASRDYYSLKLSGQNVRESVAFVEDKFTEIYPGNLFKFQFMDEAFNRQYDADQQFGAIFNVFSLLAILIACLGLFGLAGYNAVQRTKEIGVRKVLGASVGSIVKLMSKDFMLLILMANVLALPLVFFGARAWLSGYAYRTAIGLELFLLPVILVLFVALVTIIYHTIQSARKNPVHSLRYE